MCINVLETSLLYSQHLHLSKLCEVSGIVYILYYKETRKHIRYGRADENSISPEEGNSQAGADLQCALHQVGSLPEFLILLSNHDLLHTVLSLMVKMTPLARTMNWVLWHDWCPKPRNWNCIESLRICHQKGLRWYGPWIDLYSILVTISRMCEGGLRWPSLPKLSYLQFFVT